MTDIHELAEQFVQSLPQEILEHHITHPHEIRRGEGPLFTEKGVEAVADAFHLLIAYVIAGLLDAGSEREAVMEDEQLALALRTTLKDW